MLPLFGVRRFGQLSAMVEPLPSGLINPMGLGGPPLNHACFSFTGSNYASIAALSTNILGGQGDFTVSAMGKSTGFNGVANQRLFSAYGDATNHFGLSTPISGSQRIRMVFLAANDGGASTTTSDATVGTWLRYTYVWVAATKTMTLFLGATSISTRVYASLFDAVAATQFFLGALNDGTSKMTGAGADFRIYNVAKTVDAAWLAGLLTSAHDTTGLVAWYPYPWVDGSIRDYSGNNNHMIPTGNTLYSASGGPGLPYYPDTTGGLGPELVVNGIFSSDTGWSKGTNWSITGGVAVSSGESASSNMLQTILTIGKKYRISFNLVSRSAGSVALNAGSTAGTTRSTPNSYTEDIFCSASTNLIVAGILYFAGSIDNISVREIL